MALPRPTNIGWVPDEDPGKAVEPSPSKKTAGFFPDERPDPKHHNWLWARLSNIVDYLYSVVDESQAARFNAVVGTSDGCTHATLQAAIDDATAGWKILVTESASIASRITVDIADIEIEFMPGVNYTKSADTVCMEYTTARVKVRGGRFVGYSGGSDIVHRYLSGADYCHLLESYFSTGTNSDYDDSGVTVGKKPIVAMTVAEV